MRGLDIRWATESLRAGRRDLLGTLVGTAGRKSRRTNSPRVRRDNNAAIDFANLSQLNRLMIVKVIRDKQRGFRDIAKKNDFSSSDRKAAVKRGWFMVLAVLRRRSMFLCTHSASVRCRTILGLLWRSVCRHNLAALVSVGAGFVIDSVSGTGVWLTPFFLCFCFQVCQKNSCPDFFRI